MKRRSGEKKGKIIARRKKKIYIVLDNKNNIIGVYGNKKGSWNKAVKYLSPYKINNSAKTKKLFYRENWCILLGKKNRSEKYVKILLYYLNK